MQRPTEGVGAVNPDNVDDTREDRLIADRETVGAEDAAADAAASGADRVGDLRSNQTTDPDRWPDDAVTDSDVDTVGREDARADAAASGADPDEVGR